MKRLLSIFQNPTWLILVLLLATTNARAQAMPQERSAKRVAAPESYIEGPEREAILQKLGLLSVNAANATAGGDGGQAPVSSDEPPFYLGVDGGYVIVYTTQAIPLPTIIQPFVVIDGVRVPLRTYRESRLCDCGFVVWTEGRNTYFSDGGTTIEVYVFVGDKLYKVQTNINSPTYASPSRVRSIAPKTDPADGHEVYELRAELPDLREPAYVYLWSRRISSEAVTRKVDGVVIDLTRDPFLRLYAPTARLTFTLCYGGQCSSAIGDVINR
jgi:hypothetical protein